MARKSRNPNFDQTLDLLRAHAFEVTAAAGPAGAMLVAKYGAAAVLVPVKGAPAALAEPPGALIQGKVARLLDRGYQKFLDTPQFELPATAAHLEAIHRFSEELNQLIGATSLYNQSLGTTSDLYQYDRLKGRETVHAAPPRPWDSAAGH